ncbi:DNA polymerase iota subunit [Patellaria atrata CBS 101060]|uniref:DNA polymerase iota subunit n=1 Tax=Patellaria atrata CBS 101060 TaxID=1346257 RepID=A0A9P4VTH1_9PEZI|nr:DNA polymerase iota subunit [Patellaria atrata CBS 101060]
MSGHNSLSPNRSSFDAKDDRVIIHFDYDCFYASVLEAENPSLKSLPLAVQQKQIVVTCNYEARRRGLKKLQLIKEAKRICPEVVIVLGEDLTKFRNVSKDLYNFLREYSWNGKAERLGFDEVFLDISDIVDYNIGLLNTNDLTNSFFCLSRDDPTVGFCYDASIFAGHAFPSQQRDSYTTPLDPLRLKLHLGSHFAQFVRHQLEEQKGYTSTVGISTTKLLAKLVGNQNKPKGQTVLLPPYNESNDQESNVIAFLNAHDIGKIPGIGFKLAQKIRAHVLQRPADSDNGLIYGETKEDKVSVRDVRTCSNIGPDVLEKLLAGPGAPRGIGLQIWALLHGADADEVGQARELPRQISIEDSYIRLDSIDQVTKELTTLAKSLINRMHLDLLEEDDENAASKTAEYSIPATNIILKNRKWLTHPKTLRLSTRARPAMNTDGSHAHNSARVSRSAPLPNFIFALTESLELLAERLVKEALLPLFRKLHPDKGGWTLRNLNVAVTNMMDTGSDSKAATGRDIGKMFKRQNEILKEWTIGDRDAPPDFTQKEHVDVVDRTHCSKDVAMITSMQGSEDFLLSSQQTQDGDVWETDEDMDGQSFSACNTCGAMMPAFAMVAHERFHLLGE